MVARIGLYRIREYIVNCTNLDSYFGIFLFVPVQRLATLCLKWLCPCCSSSTVLCPVRD